MTSAPIAEQRLLIDLQDIDAGLARLAHERRALPVLARIETTITRLKDNKRAALLATAALSEAKQGATHAEDEVGQVVRRAAVLRERLAAGGDAARDLTAIQGEIDQLGQRQSALEEAQIVAMEALDSARQEAERLSQEEAEIRAAGRELTAKRDAEFARLDEEIESLENQRADLAGTIEAPLLADYEAVRTSTGGLGAVALRGRTVEGGAVEISPQELARIVAAPAGTADSSTAAKSARAAHRSTTKRFFSIEFSCSSSFNSLVTGAAEGTGPAEPSSATPDRVPPRRSGQRPHRRFR